MTNDELVRFLKKVRITPTCWEWIGAKSNGRYGKMYVQGRLVGAHRLSYEHFVGPIPQDYEIDHVVCANPGCVRPDHLEPVPRVGRINTVRFYAQKTHCNYGHEFTDENTYRDKYGHRSCKKCRQRVYTQWRMDNPERWAEICRASRERQRNR